MSWINDAKKRSEQIETDRLNSDGLKKEIQESIRNEETRMTIEKFYGAIPETMLEFEAMVESLKMDGIDVTVIAGRSGGLYLGNDGHYRVLLSQVGNFEERIWMDDSFEGGYETKKSNCLVVQWTFIFDNHPMFNITLGIDSSNRQNSPTMSSEEFKNQILFELGKWFS